jgi:hypothetical protein
MKRPGVIDLCSESLCMNNATQLAQPPGFPGLRVPLCDKHVGMFVRKAASKGIKLEELGLTPIEKETRHAE